MTLEVTIATFGTPCYAGFPRDGGMAAAQAETHAEAARQFIVADLATREDLATALENLGLRLGVRFGIMPAAGLGLLTAILGAMMRFFRYCPVSLMAREESQWIARTERVCRAWPDTGCSVGTNQDGGAGHAPAPCVSHDRCWQSRAAWRPGRRTRAGPGKNLPHCCGQP